MHCVAGLALARGDRRRARRSMQINGAGATFPYPIYSKWFAEYNKLQPERPDQLPVDRLRRRHPAADEADGVLRRHRRADDRRADAGGARQDPAHPDGARRRRAGLQPSRRQRPSSSSTARVLADIFLGKITKWNDPAIAKLNPGVKLPATDITVVHRSDGCGTTYICVDYLAKVSPEWKKKVGVDTAVNWPVGLGGKGNEGVAGLVTADAGHDRLRRADLRPAEQDRLRLGAEQGRRVREARRCSR